MDELDIVMSFYYIYLVAILQRARLPLWLFTWKKQNYELNRYFYILGVVEVDVISFFVTCIYWDCEIPC